MLLILDNYDSFTYNLVQLARGCGADVRVVRNDAMDVEMLAALAPDRLIVSPGPKDPAHAGISCAAIRRFAGRIPILGVCLGHQAIAEAFGGRVIRAPRLMHGKTSRIRHDGRGVYRDVPSPFTAARYHSLIVDAAALPSDFEAVSFTEEGELMGIRHREWPVEGLQFHPESFLTAEGERLLRNFLAPHPCEAVCP